MPGYTGKRRIVRHSGTTNDLCVKNVHLGKYVFLLSEEIQSDLHEIR